MSRKFDQILLYSVALAVLLLSGMWMRNIYATPKIAFVDIGKMVADYKFKKDLEKVSENGLYRIKAVIDSLGMVKKIGTTDKKVDTMLASAEFAFQKYYEQSNLEINKKVWSRLNPLIDKYGKEKDMQLIIGATGTGTVLYGNHATDVTEDITQYINRHFEKGS